MGEDRQVDVGEDIPIFGLKSWTYDTKGLNVLGYYVMYILGFTSIRNHGIEIIEDNISLDNI